MTFLNLEAACEVETFVITHFLHLPAVKTSTRQSTFQYAGARDWNSLPRDITDTSDFKSFKNVLFKYLQSTDVDCHICTVV